MAKPPEKPCAGKRPARPTPEELALFRAVMSDAAPIPRRRKAAAPADEPVATTPPPAKRKAPAAVPRPVPVPAPAARPKAPPLEAGVAAGVDRRTMDRLRKGTMRPEGTIDLHGMTAAAAHRALGTFLSGAQAAGKRCVLVITGKGSLKEGGGVIRRELPAWLNAPENRGRVLGFSQAKPGDGGGGAFYVLLKRARDGGAGPKLRG